MIGVLIFGCCVLVARRVGERGGCVHCASWWLRRLPERVGLARAGALRELRLRRTTVEALTAAAPSAAATAARAESTIYKSVKICFK